MSENVVIEDLYNETRAHDKGCQAGLKRGAERIRDDGAKFQFGTEGKSKDWYIGVADALEHLEQAILKEMNGERKNT